MAAEPVVSAVAPKRDVVVVGASAGGVEALRELVAQLPADFPAAVLVVLHLPPTGGSVLPRILERAGDLPASHAKDDEPLLPGRIYTAPPDRHLILHADLLNGDSLNGDRVRLARGPRENGYRPAVDVLFRSAARAVGARTIAVVLSGALDDGTAGAQIVAARGGTVLIQDPRDALYPGMPANALEVVRPELVGSAADLGKELARLAGTAIPTYAPDTDRELDLETAMAEIDQTALDEPDRPGVPSGFSCPDCQGSLFELVGSSGPVRYRCRVGHAWTAVSLLAQQDAGLEHALWMSLRSLEEKAALARRMAHVATDRGSSRTAQMYLEAAEDALRATGVLRDLLLRQPAQVRAEIDEALSESRLEP
jgi:two-component system chemotaxis response regulator CheB